MKTSLEELAGRLMRCPAAPYHESGVATEALRICQEHGLRVVIDPFGNLLLKLQRSRTPPFVLAAHLDHPGFVIRSGKSPRVLEGEFLGGVADEYFKPEVPLRLHPGGKIASLGKRLSRDQKIFEILVREQPSSAPSFAVWDLPDFDLAGGKIMGRSCDDLVGAATILDVMISLAASQARVNVIGVLSRAEEVGFHGALALAQSGTLPMNSLLVSLETSREMPPVRMEHGVIIRVGDRASTFDSEATRFLAESAADLAKAQPHFKFQRALMSGGTCEATAYQEHGYRCAAVCVALGNYHNCGPDTTLAPEFVSLADARNMSRLLQTCALEMKNYKKITARLPQCLQIYSREAIRALRQQKLDLGSSLNR